MASQPPGQPGPPSSAPGGFPRPPPSGPPPPPAPPSSPPQYQPPQYPGPYGYQPPAVSPYAGFWSRLAAWLIDWLILFVVEFTVGFVIGIVAAITGGAQEISHGTAFTALLYVVGILVNLAYFTFFWSTEGGGQTVGNRALKIQIVRSSSGQNLSAPRAFARAILMYLSIVLVCAGLIASVVLILATQRKQALHDLAVGSVVVKAA